MNSDDSIRIALDVICEPIWFDWKNQTCRETLVRFIKEIYESGRADERERLFKWGHGLQVITADKPATAIRAREEQ